MKEHLFSARFVVSSLFLSNSPFSLSAPVCKISLSHLAGHIHAASAREYTSLPPN